MSKIVKQYIIKDVEALIKAEKHAEEMRKEAATINQHASIANSKVAAAKDTLAEHMKSETELYVKASGEIYYIEVCNGAEPVRITRINIISKEEL